MPRLTKRLVDSISPDPKRADKIVWDDALKGFGLRLRASGSKSWVIVYRTEHGRLRKFRLGQVTALTADEARQMARQKLAAVDRGEDPAEERGLGYPGPERKRWLARRAHEGTGPASAERGARP